LKNITKADTALYEDVEVL